MPRRGTSLGAEPAEARAPPAAERASMQVEARLGPAEARAQPAAECMLARVEAQAEAAAERAPVQVEARLGPPVEGR